MTKIMRKIMTAVLSLAMVACFVPQTGMQVYAADGDPAMVAGAESVLKGTANTDDAQTVWYAGHTWRVIGYGAGQEGGTPQVASSAGTMTLIKDNILKSGVEFSEGDNEVNRYKDSNLYGVINDLTNETNGIFSAGEKAGIVPRDLETGGFTEDPPYTNGIAGEKVEGALLWPLSTQEAYYMNSGLRNAADLWWLRSPGIEVGRAAIVGVYGEVEYLGIEVYDDNYVSLHDYGVRPAFYLDLGSVLFTSAAVGGKSSGAEGVLNEVGANSTNEWELTLLNDVHENFAIDFAKITDDSAAGTVTVPYSGAATGEKEYISAIIKDGSGNIKYYGRIDEASSVQDASVTIDITGKLGDGDTLCVFNEQYNGEKKTDYSSELIDIITPAAVTYTVIFVDGQGKTLKTEKVESGKAATAPADPKRSGYTFTGWDKDFSKVTADMTVTAKWKKNAEPAPAAKISGTLLSKLTAKGKSSLVLTWNKVKGAEGYDIFFIRCGKGSPKKVKTIKGNKTFKWTKKSLKTKKAYKAVVKAYVMKNGRKTYVRTSPMVHAYTAGGTSKYTNSKGVTVKKTNVSLKAGKTYRIKANVAKLRKGKKLMPAGHAPKLRYISSNKRIATVSKSGKIRAKSKGSCKVYVIAVNGARKAVTVTVK